VEQFRVKQHPEPELGARIHHTAEGSCDEEPSCTRVRGGYKTLARLPGPILLDRGLLLASWGPESPRSPSARDRGHPLCGFWGVETEATRLLSVPKTEASLGQLWVRS